MQSTIASPTAEAAVSNVEWPLSPARCELLEHQVHVWSASLDAPAIQVDVLEAALSEDEHARARRFLRVADQRRFIVGRGVLRHLLASYLECDPASVAFVYGASGKPALAGPDPATGIEFNLAHSEGLAVYAFTKGLDVGIDIEAIREIGDMDGIAQRFFAPDEVKRLHLLPREHSRQAFFNCWTRKEAFLKGKGQGIGNGLDQFEVSMAPGEPAALVRSRLNPRDAREWTLFDLRPAQGYAAALAVRAIEVDLCCWRWSGQPCGLGVG